MATAGRRFFRHPVFVGCLALALATFAWIYLSGKHTRPIISDGWGYYLHLPAAFVWDDLELSFLNDPDLPPTVAQYRSPDGTWQGLSPTPTGYLDKYALGPAMLELPFFLVALAIATATLPAVTGFETPFQVMSAVSAAFYFALGCFFAYRAARLRYDPAPSMLAVGFAVLATNILHYVTVEPNFSHVYGFCLIAGVVYLTVRRVELGSAPPLREFAVFGALIGLAVMVRPTNAVAALLFLVFARQAPGGRIAAGGALGFLASAVAASPQMLLWLATTGQPLYYSYVGEYFHFLAPQLGGYLVGVRKGVFFWHPAYLLMILAVVAQILRRRFEGLVVLAILGLNIYLGAAWFVPWFGHSFGCRQIIEMIPLMILPTAAAIGWFRDRGLRRLATGAAVLLILVNGVQFYGYLIGTVPHDETTMESYLHFWADPFRLGW